MWKNMNNAENRTSGLVGPIRSTAHWASKAGMTKYRIDRVNRLITASTVAQWLWRAVLITAPNNRVDRILAASVLRSTFSTVLERAVLSLGTDHSSACVAAPTSRTFNYRDDRTFKQDVDDDCLNSCIARYLSIISRAAHSSAVPFCERSRVHAGNYAVDAVFSQTPARHLQSAV